MGPGSPNWLVYFMVDDVDAAVKKAGGLGAGPPIVPGMDIPNMGRFAVLKDPQGGVFSIFKPAAVLAPSRGSNFRSWPDRRLCRLPGSYTLTKIRLA